MRWVSFVESMKAWAWRLSFAAVESTREQLESLSARVRVGSNRRSACTQRGGPVESVLLLDKEDFHDSNAKQDNEGRGD